MPFRYRLKKKDFDKLLVFVIFLDKTGNHLNL